MNAVCVVSSNLNGQKLSYSYISWDKFQSLFAKWEGNIEACLKCGDCHVRHKQQQKLAHTESWVK